VLSLENTLLFASAYSDAPNPLLLFFLLEDTVSHHHHIVNHHVHSLLLLSFLSDRIGQQLLDLTGKCKSNTHQLLRTAEDNVS
jgi:hypothetical protein